ncbi:excinuclease ABC subunit B [Octadecabacter sp. SW4]|uniref:excinuclease ABC subunit B n=1 Tax=Octadecabacter sp. SW4 TaxID=2602067 RepID=UPI0011C1F4CF|nr:excinuclease ABC subunit B [Octadecabacter sp. SW4]QEE34855.1 excinuclease ABC subunit B [Octadecabacter sp. SW4]
MRFAVILALAPVPALAWEFSPDPICTLAHDTDTAEIVITYDVNLPEYALAITLKNGTWADAPVFGMEFIGPRPLAIGTDRHVTDGATLTVRDSGFGNVLDGLEYNAGAVAVSGATTIPMLLTDAAPAVRAFRACPSDSPTTS